MKSLAVVSVFALGLASALPSHAFEIYDPTVDTSSTANAGAVVFGGTVRGESALNNRDRWNGEVFAGANECLRIAITAQNTDLETVVVRPDGGVARDDDGGVSGCTTCPVVKILTGTQRGWYTVSIGHWSGAVARSDFILRYGRYNASNPNCSSPTPIRSLADSRTGKSGSSSGKTGDGTAR